MNTRRSFLESLCVLPFFGFLSRKKVHAPRDWDFPGNSYFAIYGIGCITRSGYIELKNPEDSFKFNEVIGPCPEGYKRWSVIADISPDGRKIYWQTTDKKV